MKGLLLKDWYMMKKYCRYHLFVSIGFIILSMMSSGNMFFVFYPCLLAGMIPVNLLGYDERSRWTEYVGTLPYTKTQIVSAKYLIGLFTQIAMLTVICIVQGVKMGIEGNFILQTFLEDRGCDNASCTHHTYHHIVGSTTFFYSVFEDKRENQRRGNARHYQQEHH